MRWSTLSGAITENKLSETSKDDDNSHVHMQ